MGRPLKYLIGPRIESVGALVEEIEARRYVIVKRDDPRDPGHRTHPGWAASWPLNLAMREIKLGVIYRALPNPDHPDNLAPRG
jgi:hypothetical protein